MLGFPVIPVGIGIISFCSVSTQYFAMWMRKLNANPGLFSASSWWTGEWSECSRSCNGGLRTREVLCKRRISATEEKVLDDSACTPTRPSLTEPCSNHSCPPEWLALDWSEVGSKSSIMHVVCVAKMFFTQLMAEFEPILEFLQNSSRMKQ